MLENAGSKCVVNIGFVVGETDGTWHGTVLHLILHCWLQYHTVLHSVVKKILLFLWCWLGDLFSYGTGYDTYMYVFCCGVIMKLWTIKAIAVKLLFQVIFQQVFNMVPLLNNFEAWTPYCQVYIGILRGLIWSQQYLFRNTAHIVFTTPNGSISELCWPIMR